MKVEWKVADNIKKSLQEMVERSNDLSSYLNRNLFRQYQKAQIERWETENSSQGGQWDRLNPTYEMRKKTKFASFPGSGNVMMVATGHLKDGATGRDPAYFLKLVSNKQFTISINTGSLPYAVYPGVQRPFMEFSDDTERRWMDGITQFLGRGEVSL